jgi:hypothetical protein
MKYYGLHARMIQGGTCYLLQHPNELVFVEAFVVDIILELILANYRTAKIVDDQGNNVIDPVKKLIW